MTTEITVRGTATESAPPERGTVYATLGYDGPEMGPVYDGVAGDLESVRASILPLYGTDDGAVTSWSAERMRTWSNRPWNDEGKQLPLVHHASVSVRVEFRDFSALSRWVGGHVADTEGFSVDHVAWALTTASHDELLRTVRTTAVQDAVNRAQQYADALGLSTVRPVGMADAGMLGVARSDGRYDSDVMAMAAPPGGRRQDVELEPADIRVSVQVDARFLADES